MGTFLPNESYGESLSGRSSNTQPSNSGVASPNVWGPKQFGGPKFLHLGEKQYFVLGRRPSKDQMTKYVKNVGGMAPLPPGYAYAFQLRGRYSTIALIAVH